MSRPWWLLGAPPSPPLPQPPGAPPLSPQGTAAGPPAPAMSSVMDPAIREAHARSLLANRPSLFNPANPADPATVVGQFGDLGHAVIQYMHGQPVEMPEGGVVARTGDIGNRLMQLAGAEPYGPQTPAGYETRDTGPLRALETGPESTMLGRLRAAAGPALGPGRFQSVLKTQPGIAMPTPGTTPTGEFAFLGPEYPPLGEPVETPRGRGKEGTYLAKGHTPVSTRLLEARRIVSGELGDPGIEKPYFDPEKRFDVNPKNYPAPPDVYNEGLPKNQETIDRWRKKIQTPEARKRVQQAYDYGVKSGGHNNWYMLGQLEKEFTGELGTKEGRAAFKRFVDAMGATTGGADPEDNLLMAHFGNYKAARGEPVPENAYELPSPVGSRYPSGNMKMYNRIMNQGEPLDINMPKRASFSGNFLGNAGSPTIDEVMTNVINPGKGAPEGDSYFAYAELIRDMAKKNGVSPREFQEVVWGGDKAKRALAEGKSYTGKPFIQTINEAIARTARLTGKSPRDVVRQNIVRGQGPLYALMGAAGLGGAVAAGGGQAPAAGNQQ